MIQANEQGNYITLEKAVADFLRPKGNWKPVIGFEKLYEVSDAGEVWSVRRKKLVLQSKARYRQVSLCNVEQKTIPVHRLVAAAFVSNPDGKRYVNHIDGNKHNNRADNLEWCTHAENVGHAVKMGLVKPPKLGYGDKHPASKLTNIDILMIKVLRENEFTLAQIAKRFGVSQSHVGLIVRDKGRKQVKN